MRTSLLLSSGLVLLVGAVVAGPVIHRRVRFSTDPAAGPAQVEWFRRALELGGPRGRSTERRIDLKVTYPEEIRENEAPSVELRYDEERGLTGEPPGEITAAVALSSPAFQITPGEPIRRSGVPPFTFAWVVQPKAEGRYALLLDLGDLLQRDSLEVLDDKVTLNGQAVHLEDARSLVLHVRVFTVWGISRTTFEALRAGGGILGFILTYPLWIQWVRRRLGWKE